MSRATAAFPTSHCRLCGDATRADAFCPTLADTPARPAAVTSFLPHPRARKQPGITLEQLEALKDSTAAIGGIINGLPGSERALCNRGLAFKSTDFGSTVYRITETGRLLIRTQYAALKTVLQERASR